jgi:2'-5' RNA ligase
VRLFVAVNFPPILRQEVWEALQPLREANYPVRWVDVDQIHVTVKFLGNVDDERVDAIGQAVRDAAAGTRRFALPLGGAGAFPNAKRPRVVWIGCEAVPALELLQHTMERRMERFGFPLEGRPFRPHVTLGRVKRDAPPRDFRSLEADLAAIDFATVSDVSSVDLMESRLGKDGARHVCRVEGALAD